MQAYILSKMVFVFIRAKLYSAALQAATQQSLSDSISALADQKFFEEAKWVASLAEPASFEAFLENVEALPDLATFAP